MKNIEDLTGQRFGKLTVISYADTKNYKPRWNCICDCGNTTIVEGISLKRGMTKSCGCLVKEAGRKRIIDLTGQRFGKLVVLSMEEKTTKNTFWKCQCDCGNTTIVRSDRLKDGTTKSCGCYRQDQNHIPRKHGMCNTRLYRIYIGMKSRCYNPHCRKFYLYGGKGIKVCDEWLGEHGYESFVKWALANGYNNSLTIDRIDSNGNYEPSNCRWADYVTQNNHTLNNHYITYKGETHTIAEWSKITGIKYYTLYSRIKKNWDEESLFTPPKK